MTPVEQANDVLARLKPIEAEHGDMKGFSRVLYQRNRLRECRDTLEVVDLPPIVYRLEITIERIHDELANLGLSLD